MQPFQLISIQHELAMAIGQDRELDELLSHFSKTAVRRLGLAGVSWYLYDTLMSNDSEENPCRTTLTHLFSLPHVTNPVVAKPSDQPSASWKTNGFWFYQLQLPKAGYLLLVRKSKPMSDSVLAALLPIAEKLAQSIIGCIEHEALLRSNQLLIEARQRLNHQLQYDELTGALNRNGLLAQLDQHTNSQTASFGALLFLDLDRFKWVNDSFGHHVGDDLLRSMAQLLLLLANDKGLIARLSGDEFVILLKSTSAKRADVESIALKLGHQINTRLVSPMKAGRHQFQISASIGVRVFNTKETHPAIILRDADIAMYQSKVHRNNRTVLYRREMSVALDQKLDKERELRSAILQGQGFKMMYQAQVNNHGDISGAEALIRWEHPSEGELLPDRFVNLAEEMGIICELGAWVVKEVLTDFRTAINNGLPVSFERISINISPNQLEQRNFVEWFDNTLHQFDVPAERVCIELTENGFVGSVDPIIQKIKSLNELGVHVAIDDFGKGYSSLRYLQELPINIVKIDKAFIRGIDKDARAANLSQSILQLCQALDMKAVAEGIETQGEADALIAQGYERLQGFLFSKPEPLETLLARYKS
ncbi:MAG: EAL domain-containing protein [Halieaceae bacterium]|nr:EAL domain-containing protein [Halieaceae bacterium]